MMKGKSCANVYVYRDIVKRILDIIVSLVLLTILLIPGILIAILIKLTSKGPIFFKQERVGWNSQLFNIYKFRSMAVDAPHNMTTAAFTNANQYITTVGRFLRKTSIDELPQLLNVLKGDMSIVGPRPLIPAEHAINYQRHELGIDQLLPGITGLAQVNGRDLLNDQDKLAFDKQYYEHVSFLMDTKIIVKTIANVIISKDIQDGQSKNGR